ncbi:hypothetical protein [Robertmurraya korlensis]|uniref:hypothetical protein n=1 Tax=Robertmurraya korlensis TaxID=519977 RepID=UPI0008252C95|nr:hypothetical protein [Robertmurraya korlensis]
MKKLLLTVLSLLFAFSIYIPQTNATESNPCAQYAGVKKIWWNGVELKKGQIGRLTVLKDTQLYIIKEIKGEGEIKLFYRTLKKGESYRIYAFKPGMLSVGGGYFVDRDSKVSYETPSKAKLAAVACINQSNVEILPKGYVEVQKALADNPGFVLRNGNDGKGFALINDTKQHGVFTYNGSGEMFIVSVQEDELPIIAEASIILGNPLSKEETIKALKGFINYEDPVEKKVGDLNVYIGDAGTGKHAVIVWK